ncbi:MAG TPA: hypothetical protein VF619_14025 [Allosphingosinicella sp.]|jgi:hypothetical protein
MSAGGIRPAGLALLLAAAPAPAFAAAPEAPLTAERAAEIQRQGLREAVGTAPCERESVGADIVVCGRRAPYEPIPWEKVPGARDSLLAGELPRAQASFDTCAVGCQPSGIRFDVLRTVKVGSKIVRHILGKDD